MLNRELLSDNACFGCGHANHAGLRIEIFRDPDRAERLRGRFTPRKDMSGFPGVVHGGTIYTALDCLSTWVATLLGPDRGAAWVLRSASTLYHRPARPEEPLGLLGWIETLGGSSDPLTVRAEARRANGALCVEATFKVVPLSPHRLAEIAGLPALPGNWRAFLSGDPG